MKLKKKIGFYFLSLIFSEINVVYVLVLVWFDLYADEVLRVRKHSYVTPHSAALPVTNKSIFSLLVKPLFCVIHFFFTIIQKVFYASSYRVCNCFYFFWLFKNTLLSFIYFFFKYKKLFVLKYKFSDSFFCVWTQLYFLKCVK